MCIIKIEKKWITYSQSLSTFLAAFETVYYQLYIYKSYIFMNLKFMNQIIQKNKK